LIGKPPVAEDHVTAIFVADSALPDTLAGGKGSAGVVTGTTGDM
jgi:hypothetical protein